MFPVNRRSFVRPFALIVLIALANIAAFAQTTDDISPEVRQQIADILEAKRTFSVGERKISSRLVFANRRARLGSRAIGNNSDANSLIDMSMVDSKGMVEVLIKGTVTSALLNQIRTFGGQVENSSATYGAVLAKVPIKNLDQLAARSDIRSVGEPEQYMLNSSVSRGEKLLNSLSSLRAGYAAFAGSLMSQGYISHRVNQVPLAINGTGVKVGVLSDSATAARITALQGSGDLGPGTTVIAGQNGAGTDEGAAMMEIVQDMAPGAQVYFATANPTQAQMAANITALSAAGCTIIVDDVSYFAEPAFQDGPIAVAINTFVAGGGLYFSSAGNSGNLTNLTSGTWEGDYLAGSAVSGPIATAGETGTFHNFGTPGSPQEYDVLTAINTSRVYSLKWSDPLGGSSNDYDLFNLNSTGTTLKNFSAGVQSGSQDPVELFQGTTTGTGLVAVNDRLVVVAFIPSPAGTPVPAPRALRLDAHRGRLSINTVGATFGHNAAQNTVTVAATAWNSASQGTTPFIGGASNPVEVFNSDGPRRIFYTPAGVAITPGNFLFATNGGTALSKPDITAADGVVTRTPGFNPFFGTSAAAPHAAGIAALIKSAKPAWTNAQILAVMKSTALDNMSAGVDRDGGSGVIMAYQAIQAALLLP